MKHARDDYARIQDPAGLIPGDEPVFLLRGQDLYAAPIVRAYAQAVEEVRPDIAKLAFEQADRMDAWARHKLPDLPTTFDAIPGRLKVGAR